MAGFGVLEVVSADGRDATVDADAYVLAAVAEGSCAVGARRGSLVDGVAAEWLEAYSMRLDCPKREVLGKEYFCLEEEVLRVCCEVSSSAIPIKSLLKCNQLKQTNHNVPPLHSE